PVYNTGVLFYNFLIELEKMFPVLEHLGVMPHCVAVDDASTDETTLRILNKPPIPLVVVRRNENEGCCEGLFTALECVNKNSGGGDFMAWLDSDGEHKPSALVGVFMTVQSGIADLALSQIIFRESDMLEFDRRLQESMGALEARIILGPEHCWHQHCPGCWVVTAEYVRKGAGLFRRYLDFYREIHGEIARWGEDMSWMKMVHALGGRINYQNITLSHMKTPNRPEAKVVSQYYHALQHLMGYEKFFQR
ncbi:glycosyltransferase, partial [bacterium]|nr:glycosyltransferase [bacterium]